MKRYFLTGTDTDAGKTLISAALLQRSGLSGVALDVLATMGPRLLPMRCGSRVRTQPGAIH